MEQKTTLSARTILMSLFLVGFTFIYAADVALRFTTKPSSAASYTFSTGDILYAVDATTMTGSNSNTCFVSPNNIRVQLKEVILALTSTSASAITVHGMSSGSTSARTIYQISVADTKDGTYTLVDDVTLANTKITSTISGNTTCGTSIATGLIIAKGKFVKISFCTGTSGSPTQNLNLSGFTITPGATTPSVVLKSGSIPSPAMETLAMTPVVFSYLNVADNNNVISNFYTNNADTTITTPPTGISFSKNTTDNTITLSGTPPTGTAGTYYYKLKVKETGGDSISGSLIISPYSTPTPVITVPANSSQSLKAGSKITDIIFTLKNATDATVTGLPSGITAAYKNDSCTISGKIDSTATPGAYAYIVKATPLEGYTGSEITATGTILVKDSMATRVLYLAATTVTNANDLLLNQLNSSPKYLVTQRAAIAGFTGNYDNYDLIVLHESLTGGDAATAGHELNLMKTVDKPILNTKSYFYTAGTTPRWGWGTPNNGNAGKGLVAVQPSHPIFDGITLSDSLYIYNTVTAKNIQPVTAVTIGGYQIGKVAGGIAIHDVPASVRLGAGKTSKYLMISLLSTKFNDLSADGLKLLDNAIHYLLSGTQFAAPSLEIASFKVDTASAIIVHSPAAISLVLPTGTDLTALKPTIELSGIGTTVSPASGVATNFSTSGTTAVNYTVTDGINTKVYAVSITTEPAGVVQLKLKGVYFDGQTVRNDNQAFLQVYNAVGSPVSSSYSNINMTQFSKGIYIVKCNSGSLKIAVLK